MNNISQDNLELQKADKDLTKLFHKTTVFELRTLNYCNYKEFGQNRCKDPGMSLGFRKLTHFQLEASDSPRELPHQLRLQLIFLSAMSKKKRNKINEGTMSKASPTSTKITCRTGLRKLTIPLQNYDGSDSEHNMIQYDFNMIQF